MIFNNQLIYIHIGKTGGMSCADYLLNNLKPRIFNCHAGADTEVVAHDKTLVVPLTNIGRHCTLAEALAFIKAYNGKCLSDFEKVLTVIRSPYSLEYSYYQHLRKPRVMARRLKEARPELVELAQGEFKQFVAKSGYHREGVAPDQYFRLDGIVPEQLELIRFEELPLSLTHATEGDRRAGDEFPMPHRNKSQQSFNPELLLDGELEELIYQKHRYFFDSGLYQRQRVS